MRKKDPTWDVVGLGLNATDVIIEAPVYPAFNSKVKFSASSWQAGGQVATAMVVCQRLGLRAKYVGRLGSDAMGEFQRESLSREGVDLRDAKVVEDCPNQMAYIVIDQGSGERTILWRRDPRLTIQPEELRPEMFTQARALHLDAHDTAAAAQAARWARAAGLPVVLDVDNVYPGLDDLLAHAEYLIGSSRFPSAYTGKEEMFSALEEIQRRFLVKLVAATLGREGVVALENGRFIYQPGYQVECRDTTGAGDVFHGAFVFALLQNWPIDQMLDFSNAMAALSCRGLGARGGIATQQEAEKLMAGGRRHPPRWTSLPTPSGQGVPR